MNGNPEIRKPQPTVLLCPACGVALAMSERQNIEIDYCPSCRGVWLDRGELDKIIERSNVEAGSAPVRDSAGKGRDRDERSGHDAGYSRGHHGGGGYRRKSWLQELFD